MVSEKYLKSKIQLDFSKKKVEKSGRAVRKGASSAEDIEVIQNFRASHIYPLSIVRQLIARHLKKLGLFENSILVSRLKRLPTILDKLSRNSLDGKAENAISLKRMQDIGGARVILNDVEEADLLLKSILSSTSSHDIKHIDYMASPKKSGYRGYHLIFKCFHKHEPHPWHNFLIEAQIRTRLQHLWATTVEIVDIIEKLDLKTNIQHGNKAWKEFFVVLGELFAHKDEIEMMTTEKLISRISRLAELNQSLGVYTKLNVFNQAYREHDIQKVSKQTKYTILVFEPENNSCTAYFFKNKQRALDCYNENEKNADLDVLMVASSNISQLEKAYPNYLIDTGDFLREMKQLSLRD